MAFPAGFQWRDVDDDAAAGIGAFAKADDQHIARHAEIFDGAGQGKAVGRNDADIGLTVHKAFRIKILGVNDGAVNIGENLEFIGHAGVITVRRQAIADAAVPALRLDKGFNHAGRLGLFADPDVGQYGHNHSLLTEPLLPICDVRASVRHEKIVRILRAPKSGLLQAGRTKAVRQQFGQTICRIARCVGAMHRNVDVREVRHFLDNLTTATAGRDRVCAGSDLSGQAARDRNFADRA